MPNPTTAETTQNHNILKSKGLRLAAIAALAGSALVGCGENDNSVNAAPTTSETSTSVETEQAFDITGPLPEKFESQEQYDAYLAATSPELPDQLLPIAERNQAVIQDALIIPDAPETIVYERQRAAREVALTEFFDKLPGALNSVSAKGDFASEQELLDAAVEIYGPTLIQEARTQNISLERMNNEILPQIEVFAKPKLIEDLYVNPVLEALPIGAGDARFSDFVSAGVSTRVSAEILGEAPVYEFGGTVDVAGGDLMMGSPQGETGYMFLVTANWVRGDNGGEHDMIMQGTVSDRADGMDQVTNLVDTGKMPQ